MNYEHVNHPPHYNKHPSGVEAIVLCEKLTFNLGTAIKYLFRVGHKPNNAAKQDLEKALWYLKRENNRVAIDVIPKTAEPVIVSIRLADPSSVLGQVLFHMQAGNRYPQLAAMIDVVQRALTLSSTQE